jgi:hypothetical protein
MPASNPCFRENAVAAGFLSTQAAAGSTAFVLDRVLKAARELQTVPRVVVPTHQQVCVSAPYSTVTLLARLRGWSTSQPRRTAR